MDVLQVLEQKIGSLLELVKKLTERSKALEVEKGQLEAALEDITGKHTQLFQDYTQLRTHLEQLEKSALQGNFQLEDLNQEKALTKLVLDDIIQSIDSLVKRENQHE